MPCFLHCLKAKDIKPYVQQNLMFYQSDRITMGGFGGSIGAKAELGEHVFSSAEIGILWANGNAIPTTFSIGYHKSGVWQPAVIGNITLLWGQRTEILNDAGERPIIPLYTAGLKLAPLRYNIKGSVFSTLELGYGIGPYKGSCYSLTVLSANLW